MQVGVNMDSIPVYFRGGSILAVRTRARRSTAAAAQDPFTLIVAMNAQGEASGDLYLDDGKSYAFQRGVFLHREFTFEKGALSSRALPTAAGQKYAPQLFVERIVILGAKVGPAGLKAQLAGSQNPAQVLQVAVGPLWLAPSLPDVAVVVRKPNLPISTDWTVHISG
jgi:alpha 1,3-glucosidase